MGSGYCSFGELTEFNVMFPFEYTVSKEQFMADERFTLTTFGGEMTAALKQQPFPSGSLSRS